MAARLNPHHSEAARLRIKVAHLIKGLQDHFDGKREMTKTQVQSAHILLSKSLSNAPEKHEHEHQGELKINVNFK
jgi:hypothetical protein